MVHAHALGRVVSAALLATVFLVSSAAGYGTANAENQPESNTTIVQPANFGSSIISGAGGSLNN